MRLTLTPGPLHLLVAMSRGDVLRETAARGPCFWLIRPSVDGFESVHARAVHTLIRRALIERSNDIDWRVSASGRAWLAANGIAARSDKLARHPVTVPG